MVRYKCKVEYAGTDFNGWQKQDNLPSIQQAIQDAIKLFCGEEAVVYPAGRTDGGVHAFGQVVHFDLVSMRDPCRVMSAINHHMRPQPVALLTAEIVDEAFHARFSAKQRHYMYRIINRRARIAIDHNRAWHVPVPLNVPAMQDAAQRLVGRHDFTSFRDSECQAKNPVRTLDTVTVEKTDAEIRIYVSAKSFLHHMVRNITGTLKLVGEGKWSPDYINTILAARNRTMAGPTAPSCGLYLTRVDY